MVRRERCFASIAFNTQYNVSVAPLVSKSKHTKCTSNVGYSCLTARSMPYSASTSRLHPSQTESDACSSRLSKIQKSMGLPTMGTMGFGTA